MSHSILTLLSFGLLALAAVAQPPRPVATALAPAALAAAEPQVAETLRRLPTNPQGRAGAVLFALRRGAVDTAETLLARGRQRLREQADAQDLAEQAAWHICAELWTLRAIGDVERVQRHLPDLQRFTEAAAARPRVRSFVHEAMQVHMLLCFGNLLDHCHDRARGGHGAKPGAIWSERAIARLLELERCSWQPGRGHHRPRPTAGDIALPEAADASLLVPAAAGMLIGSGDRTLRHLQTLLAEPRLDPADAHWLAAATLCRDDAARARGYAALLRSDALQDPDRAGFAFDALCQAVTGLRLAVGAAVDEDWVRLSPWLPPDVDRIELRDLRTHAARFDLLVTATSEHTATLQLRLVHTRDGAARTIVVHAGSTQALHIVQAGETLIAELPRSQAEPQHQTLRPGLTGN